MSGQYTVVVFPRQVSHGDHLIASKFGFDRFSSIRAAYGPSFSQDGKLLSFLSDTTGVPQVWSYNLETTHTDQLTLFDHRVSLARFSPRDELLVFSMDPGGSENHQLWTLDLGDLETRRITQRDDKIYSFGDFSPKGDALCYSSNERDSRFFDIYTQPVGGSAGKLVYENDGTNYPVDWIDEDRIIFSRSNTNLDHDLYLLDKETNETSLLTKHGDEALFHYGGHSPDGKTLYVATNKDGEFTQPAALEMDSGRLDVLGVERWDCTGGKVSPDGRFFAYVRNVKGASQLHLYNLETERDAIVRGLRLGSVEQSLLSTYDLITWSPDSRLLVFTLQGPQHNLNLWLYNTHDQSVRQLTSAPKAGIPPESFVEPSNETYTAFDGLDIPVLVYKPHGTHGPVATVVYVHGGPESQETYRFNIIIQYLANQGFLVLAPNVRGSSGYGKKWVHLDDVEKRLDSVRDLEYLVKWAVGQRLAKQDKIGIYGGSYGGFMVLSAITEYPDLWAAAVDLVGIANFTTFLERTAKWRRHLRTAEYGDPEKHRELFKRISPIHNVDKIQAPLLVIHGANDPRVPVQEAEQIVGRLKELGRHVEYLRFEDEGHGIAKIPNRTRAYTTISDFLSRTLAVD